MSLKDLNALSCPLSTEQLNALTHTLGDFTPQQQIWVSGYLAGLHIASKELSTAEHLSGVKTVTIVYASQTGNAKAVAESVYQQARAKNVSVQLMNISDYKLKSLKKEDYLVIVASTNGEGEPPDDGLAFHEFLATSKAPKLDGLKYAILSLGDSSYEQFCQCGIDFDMRLVALGAVPLLDRVDCDLDYEQNVATWTEQLLVILLDELSASQPASSQCASLSESALTHYDRQHPAQATVLTNQKITGRHSTKDIRHLEFDLEGLGINYQPGDALGVWFDNDETLVDELLTCLDLDPKQSVNVDEQNISLRDALIYHYELTQTTPNFVEHWADWSANQALIELKAQKPLLREYTASHQIIDVVREYPAHVDAEQLLAALRRLTPRMYSIASSQSEVEDEVHLTVAVVRYEQADGARYGGCSGYLSRLKEGQSVRIFVEPNQNFKLPDAQTPVIMIGPGTGIAPFRAFMQHREAVGASGQNWLFFGNPHFSEEFLYQVEWQKYVKSGLLTRIDLAFSRDQGHKIYVQDRLRAQAHEVYQWLKNGAYLYVCGDATRMAKDVHQTLVSIVCEQGQMAQEDAQEWLKQLHREKRYQKDVY
ncbi:assimilatory sulfite reductase (NADPH) flavoprotein subunit [Celerinatantimonas yamalensis]|uniref:Sulfite reductase [NADPH] flavoprotein alpha-component n=1 Tax=Celerinatantimonas yamalensis TaxID=559956 RepID=A0ABW9GAC5_9GAMM